MLFPSFITACSLQGPATVAVLPGSVNPTALTAALVVGDELIVLGEAASTQPNLVTGASTSSATPNFGESFYYSPRPLAVGERIFTAYGAAVWGADDRGRGWTELASPPIRLKASSSSRSATAAC